MQQRQDQAARRPKNHASASVWVPGDFCTQKLLLMQLLYLALYSCTLISFAFAKVVTSTLTPGISHDGEALPFADSVARYSLQELKPKTGYEVRVSYPATVPSKVYLRLISPGNPELLQGHRRSLLDTEKLILYTSDKGKLGDYIVELQAEATGIHRDGPEAIPKVFLYNIVLAQLIFGLPIDALPVVAIVIVSLGAVWRMLPWWIDTAVPAILEFMEGREGGKTAEQSR